MLKFSGCPRLTWGRGPSARGCGRVWSRGWHRAAECGRDVRSATIRLSTPTRRVAPHGVLLFPPTARRGLGHGRPVSAPPARHGNAAGGVAMGGVTPRQACPRPSGLGRNLRSKTRWFTGFCNSHQVSHFATFFIDARAEISVAESRLKGSHRRAADPRVGARVPGRGAPAPGGAAALSASRFLGARRAQRVVSEPAGTRAAGVAPRAARRGRRSRGTGSPVVVLETAMILPQAVSYTHLTLPTICSV